MSELFEVAGNLGLDFLVIGGILWLAHYVFGSQALGVPAMIGIFLVIALGTMLSSLGFLVIAAMVAGLLLLYLVIGMAMSLGADRLPQAHDEKPKDV